MVPSSSLVALLLINCAWSYTDDGGLQAAMEGGDPALAYLYPDELPDDGDLEDGARKRAGNNNFLRFGRAGGGPPTYDEYDDYGEDFARPTRSGKVEKNDHFIRFGRGKQNYIRFGRDPSSHRVQRANHLRFGRSAGVDGVRAKRDAPVAFRRADSNFLRFGRPNSDFMRFGRRPRPQSDAEPSPRSEAEHEATPPQQRPTGELWQKLRRLPDTQFAAVLLEMLNGAQRRQQEEAAI